MRRLLVFSLDQVNNPAMEVDVNLVIGLLHQSGLDVRKALGVYKGQSENSYMVNVSNDGEASLVKAIARQYNQESILSVDVASFEASLVYLQGKPKRVILGHWIKTSRINKEAMTIDLSNMQGYIVR